MRYTRLLPWHKSFFLRYPQERAITGLLNENSAQAGVNYGLMA